MRKMTKFEAVAEAISTMNKKGEVVRCDIDGTDISFPVNREVRMYYFSTMQRFIQGDYSGYICITMGFTRHDWKQIIASKICDTIDAGFFIPAGK